MAKITTKRKSEGDLPDGRSKQCKTTSTTRRTRSNSSEGGEESSDAVFVEEQSAPPKHVKKSAPKSRKSEPVMRVTKTDGKRKSATVRRQDSDSSQSDDDSGDYPEAPVKSKPVKKSAPKSSKAEPVARVAKVEEKRKLGSSRKQELEDIQDEDDYSDIPKQPAAPKHVTKSAPKSRKSEPVTRAEKVVEKRKTTSTGRQRKESSPEENSSHASEPVAPKHVKKSAPKSRKSEPIMRVTKADEYEEDEGRIESQEFLALVEATSKKKKQAAKDKDEFMDNFTGHIESEEKALKKHLHKLSSASTKLDTTFFEAFTNAYAASRPKPLPSSEVSRGKTPASEVSFATLFERSTEMISNARFILQIFEEANEKTTNTQIGVAMNGDWEKQNDTAEKLIDIGRDVGLQKFEALAAGIGEPEIDEDMVMFAEAIYKPEDEVTANWGRLARKQEKAYKKLDKTLSREVMV